MISFPDIYVTVDQQNFTVTGYGTYFNINDVNNYQCTIDDLTISRIDDIYYVNSLPINENTKYIGNVAIHHWPGVIDVNGYPLFTDKLAIPFESTIIVHHFNSQSASWSDRDGHYLLNSEMLQISTYDYILQLYPVGYHLTTANKTLTVLHDSLILSEEWGTTYFTISNSSNIHCADYDLGYARSYVTNQVFEDISKDHLIGLQFMNVEYFD